MGMDFFPGWWDTFLIGSAAVVAACYGLWRQLLRPLLDFASRTADAIETLSGIAEEFQPNHGNSLHDRLTGIADDVCMIRGMTEAAILEQQRISERVERIELAHQEHQ